MIKLTNKIALITGASQGIGNAIARQYIDQNIHIIAIGRNLKLLEELDDYAKSKESSITMVQMDLKNAGKIIELHKIIQKRFGKLDILIANAAILGEVSPIEHYAFKIWNEVLAINLNANFYLVKTMSPLMRHKEKANIIFLTCEMSKKYKAYWGAYSVSKAALSRFAEICAEEYKNTNIKVSCFDPGEANTKLRKVAFPGRRGENILSATEVAKKLISAWS